MKTLIIILSMLALAAPAFARIGETEEQTEARYGKPTIAALAGDGAGVTRGYASGGFRIVVSYYEKVSQREIFIKPDGSDISDYEIFTLMAANGADCRWSMERHEYEGLPGYYEYLSVGGKSRTALYDRYKHSLTIAFTEFIKEDIAAMKRGAADRMKSF